MFFNGTIRDWTIQDVEDWVASRKVKEAQTTWNALQRWIYTSSEGQPELNPNLFRLGIMILPLIGSVILGIIGLGCYLWKRRSQGPRTRAEFYTPAPTKDDDSCSRSLTELTTWRHTQGHVPTEGQRVLSVLQEVEAVLPVVLRERMFTLTTDREMERILSALREKVLERCQSRISLKVGREQQQHQQHRWGETDPLYDAVQDDL